MKAFALAALAAALAAPALAEAPAQPVDERALVTELASKVQDIYVVPEKRAPIAARLQAALRAGRYSQSEDPQIVAELITADLAEASHDGHMYLRYNPQEAASHAAPAAAGPEAASAADRYCARLAANSNDGISEMRVLPGNIRYLRYDAFYWRGAPTKAAIDTAMRFLSGGTAAIIDMRFNGGGSPEAVNYLTSHFVEPGKHLIDFQDRSGTESSNAAAGALPAGRMTGKPLYVLSGPGAASAAEEFVAHVAYFKLGEVVGAKTAGGAHNNGLFPVGQGFVASISEGRPIHPVTGGNWEGVGIPPTIPAPEGNALSIAHALAAERIAAQPGPEQSRYAWLAESLKARVQPTELADKPEAYVGRFGERTIRIADGAIVYQRDGRPPMKLLPLAPDLFVLDGDPGTRIRIRREGGHAAAIELLRDDGSTSGFKRSGDA
jgi:hypothetical protein